MASGDGRSRELREGSGPGCKTGSEACSQDALGNLDRSERLSMYSPTDSASPAIVVAPSSRLTPDMPTKLAR